MNSRQFITAIFLFSLLPFALIAQNNANKPVYVPEEGVEGKDVIWWPTPSTLVDAMLDRAEVGPGDFVVDLGSGDGRIVIEAAKRGAIATGIEYNPDLVRLSEHKARTEGVSEKTTFLNMDLFEYDLSRATVITMYLLTDLNLRLRPRLLDLKPGIRLVSNTFDMGEWKADDEIVAHSGHENTEGDYKIYNSSTVGYFWIVPAKVQGTWSFGEGSLILQQEFQMVTGSYQTGAKSIPLENGKLKGDEIVFTINGIKYSGKVENDCMSGEFSDGVLKKTWIATKK
jgi:SAM-dependent methyltransferase